MTRAITKQNDVNPLFNVGTPIISVAAHAPIDDDDDDDDDDDLSENIYKILINFD
jgi:hypothetical protein